MFKRAFVVLLVLLTFALSSCSAIEGLLGLNQEASSSSESSSSTDTEVKHQHSYTSTVVPPVCDNKGYTRHLCACGYEYIDNFINETTTHDFKRGICSVCGEINYADIVNLVSTEAIKANVSVTVKYINKGFGFETTVGTSNGSGVIFDYSNGEYYLLTNNHVVYSKEMSERSEGRKFFVTDYSGNEYQATLVEGSAKAEYDLAILKFSSEEAYKVLDIAEMNSERGSSVISLGQPQGQPNTITMGENIGYGRVTISDSDTTECNVSFDALRHNAYINNGSSGGALLDTNLDIIGVNYAGAAPEEGKEPSSYSIPAEKIREFLTLVGYEYKPFNDGAQS